MNDEQERRLREAKRLEEAIFRVRLAQAFRRQAWLVWCVGAAVFLLSVLVVSGSEFGFTDLSRRLMLQGALFTERVYDGEWWRMLSGTWMHLNWQHLLLNLTGIILVGRHIEVAFGGSGFLSLYLAASLAGACGTLVSGHPLSIGASGALFGLLGGFLAIGARLWRRLSRPLRNSLVGVPIAVIVGIFLIDIVNDQARTDQSAHVGGLLAGLTLGLVLPMRLTDAEGYAIEVEPTRLNKGVVRALALSLSALAVAASLFLWQHSAETPAVTPPTHRPVVVNGASLLLPTDLTSGVWRSGRCEGAYVDPSWTLGHHRVACFHLPMTGQLLVGLPSQLLTLDKADVIAITRGRDERRFVWRQSNVLVAPAGGPYIYVVLGHEAMLKGYSAALAPLLPNPQAVVIPNERSRPALRSAPATSAPAAVTEGEAL